METAAEIKVLARGEPVPLNQLVRSNLVQQELTRLSINSIALLNRTVNVAPDVMGKLRDLLYRKVDRHDREWMETMPQVMGAYNITEHSTTGISPHMMLTGHEKTLPLSFFYPLYEGKRTAPRTYVRDVIRKQQDLMTYAGGTRNRRKLDKREGLIKKDSRCESLLSWQLRLGIPGNSSTKRNQKIIKEMARSISDKRGAPRRSFSSIEHWKSSSLREHQTTQCLIRGLVHPSGHSGGRLFYSASCL